MAVIGNAPFQGLVSGGEILDASIEGVDLSTSAIAARLGYTPVNPGAATFSANPTISSGTANGVGYLNGSKVLTTGSALTFDGSKLLVSSSGEQFKLLSSGDFTSTGSGYIRWYDSVGSKGYLGYIGTANTMQLSTGGSGFNLNLQATDSIIFEASAAEKMRLTSTSLYTASTINVGIGNASPGATLDLLSSTNGMVARFKSSTTYGSVVADNSSNTGGGSFVARKNGTQYAIFGVSGAILGDTSTDVGILSDSTGGGIRFYTNGSPTEKARIDSSGRLLLGVTSGTGMSVGDFAMANGKSIRFRNAADSAYISAFEFNTSNGLDIGKNGSLYTITFGISGIGEVSRFDTGGNLVIGNGSAWGRLQATKTVNNSNTTATNISDYQGATFILHNQDEVGTGNKAGMFFAFAGSPGLLAGMDGYKVNGTWDTGLRWYTNNQTGGNTGTLYERMRIAPNGSVGIGTTTPTWKLEVEGNQESLASFRSSVTTGAGYARFINGGGTFYIGIESSNGTRISNSGLAYAASMTTEGSTALTFGTNNANRMTIDSTGNIGIGTTATYNSAKVSIAGELEARGSIKSYQSSRGGLASGASVVVLSIPNGYYGAEVSMTIYISQREDGAGNLSSTSYNITAFGSGGVAITPQGSATYGGSKPFTLTAASGSGGFTVTLTNTAGGGASTGLFMAANVLVGYGAITWGW